MKKLIISLVFCAPLLLISAPGFSSSGPALYNPELRTDSTYSAGYNNLPKAGTTYAYWHRGGYHGWHRWHRGYYWHRPHYWHRWHRW